MVNATGNLTLNGIDDRELVKILEIKIAHEKTLNFSPQAMQPQVTPNKPPYYNNVQLHWTTEDGLTAVHKIVEFLLNKKAEAATQGQ